MIEEKPSCLVDIDLQILYNDFITKWEGIYLRNLEDGYPHYNSFHYVLWAHPHLASTLRKAANAMVLSGYSPEKVDTFIELYKAPCREVRLARRAEVLELKKLGEESKKEVAKEQQQRKREALREIKKGDSSNPRRKSAKQKKLTKNSHDGKGEKKVPEVDTQCRLL